MTYALLFIAAVFVCLIGVPACWAWERRQDERDREAWARMPGGPDERARWAEYLVAWKKANRQRVRDLNRLRRIRQHDAAGSDYCTAEKLKARRALYGNCCFYCGAENAASMDHRIPITRGGTEFPSNQVPCCSMCNSRKGTRTENEWRAAA